MAFRGHLPLDCEEIERHYPADECKLLWEIVETLRDLPVRERNGEGLRLLTSLWDDEFVFMSRVIWIQTKEGTPSLLNPNYAQQRFWKDVVVKCREMGVPVRGLILKARQLGFSTLIQALQYRWALLYSNRNSLTISYDEESTKSLLAKAVYAHGNTWFPRDSKYDTKSLIEFHPPHSSTFRGITAGNQNIGRGFTFQHVHCSEIPMWPDPTGTLAGMQQAIPKTLNSTVFWESTAKGMSDPFYEGWALAEKGKSTFIPFFAPWYWDEDYVHAFRDSETRTAFRRALRPDELELQRELELSDEQMHWRRMKIDEPDMTEKMFQQEYPSHPEEAFITSGSPVFDLDSILKMSRRAKQPMWRGNIVLETV